MSIMSVMGICGCGWMRGNINGPGDTGRMHERPEMGPILVMGLTLMVRKLIKNKVWRGRTRMVRRDKAGHTGHVLRAMKPT